MTPADPSRVAAAFEIISQTARKALLSKFVSKNIIGSIYKIVTEKFGLR